MDSNITLSIVIPAYKEADNLKILLPRINQVAASLNVSYEVLVVDTNIKMDHAEEICNSNTVFYRNREGSNSYGDAIRTGIKYAMGRYMLFMDADGSHDPEFIKKLYEEIVNYNLDVVIASRYVAGGTSQNSFVLKLMSLVLNMFYAAVLNLPCKDVSNSFKIYEAGQIKRLQLKCDNFDIIEEILYLLKINNPNLKIKEIPFYFKKRVFGETKRSLVVFIVSYIKTVIRLRLRK